MAFTRRPEKSPFWKSHASHSASASTGSKTGYGSRDKPAQGTDADSPRARAGAPGHAGPRSRPFTPGRYSAGPDGNQADGPRTYGRPEGRPEGRPYGPRSYGPRQEGPRPYGPRQEGPRPEGPRSYGPRPTGARPYGARPFAAQGDGPRPRPDGPRPRPDGPRAYGPRRDGPRPPYGPRTDGPRTDGPRPQGARPYAPRPDGPRTGGSRAGFARPDAARPRPGADSRPARPARPRPDFNAPAPGTPEAELAATETPRAPRTPKEGARKEATPPRPDLIQPDDDTASEAFPTVYLKPGEADRIVGGHPWIYESSVLRITRQAADGDVVQVKDHRRRLIGVGFYNAKSKIRVRVLSTHRTDLEEEFLEQRIGAALKHRRRFLPGATSFRVVNAEGDLLSGLIVDLYEDVVVIQMSSVGMDRRKDAIVRVLERLLHPRAIVERNDMGARKFEGLPETSGVLSGTLTDAELAALPLRLNGLQFEANLVSGHKTGLYLDQQVNHTLVASLARGARVLDAFSFLGGFALTAARAGAVSVIGLDQSEEAVATARRLAETNGLAGVCTYETANVFDWLRERTGAGHETDAVSSPHDGPAPFDLIVLDPPSFTRNRASIPDALRGYKEIHIRALKLLGTGGILATFCCSHHVDSRLFEAAIQEAAYDARRQLRRIAIYTQSPDHPVLPAVPETEYLKGFAFEVIAA